VDEFEERIKYLRISFDEQELIYSLEVLRSA
jgi:hypothetical protein